MTAFAEILRDVKFEVPKQHLILRTVDYSTRKVRVLGEADYTVGVPYGHHRETHLNRTHGFKPGKVVSLNPVVHTEFTCNPPTPAQYIVRMRDLGVLYNAREISGQVSPVCLQALNLSKVPPPITQNLSKEQVALTGAYAKANELQADIGLMLAEGSETLSMLVAPFQSLPKFLRKLQRGKLIPPGGWKKSAADFSADAWLQYRYGIMPLLYDIDAIRTLLEDGFIKQSESLKSKGKQVVVAENATYQDGWANVLGCAWAKYTAEIKTQQVCRARVFFRISGFNMLSRLGLDVTRIPQLMWERVPYSFMVDWAINVGDWLSAITPNDQISLLGSCTSTETLEKGIMSMSKVGYFTYDDPNYPLTAVEDTIQWQKKMYQRSTNVTLPAFPPVHVNLSSWKRKIDGLSLLWGRVPRLRR